MAEFILKDSNGKEQTFDKETIYVRGTDGELMPFTHGTGGSDDVRYVTFMSYDGLIEYGKKAVAVGDDCADPIARGVFDTPTREYDGTYDYGFLGWAAEIGGTTNGDELERIEENKTVYAVFDQFLGGEAGDNARWKLKDGTFTVYGDGEMFTTSSLKTWDGVKSEIKKVVISEGITSITPTAFMSCTNLTSVSIADTVETIRASAFNGCSQLKQKIECKATKILSNAFTESGITGITFDPRTTTLNNFVLSECTNITQVVIPDSVTAIGIGFATNSGLTSITIPDSVKKLGMNAFGSCSNLKTAVIGQGVTEIGPSCFGWGGLTSATFKNKSGWYVADTSTATSGTSLSSSNLGSTSTAATYLKTTYRDKYWLRT